MDQNNLPPQLPPSLEDENNPLVTYVAYLPGPDGKLNYFGNGEGKHRTWKTRGAAEKFLEPLLDPEVYANVVIHPIQLKIAVPMPPEDARPPKIKAGIPEMLGNIPLVPIQTLAEPSFPTAQELLEDHLKRRNEASNRKPRRQ